MISRETNHYQVVKDCVTGKQAINEKSAVSAAVLAERLEKLKRLGGCFENIEFSGAMKNVLEEASSLALC